jgi:hypothetical protein
MFLQDHSGQNNYYAILVCGVRVCVEPQFQVEWIEPLCRTEKLFTSTNRSNTPMQSLLARTKFSQSGIVHNLDDGDPEIIYSKRLRT